MVASRMYRKMPRDGASHPQMEDGPSVQKMSQELERLFATPAVDERAEEKKEGDFQPTASPTDCSPNRLLYNSPKRDYCMPSSTPSFTNLGAPSNDSEEPGVFGNMDGYSNHRTNNTNFNNNNNISCYAQQGRSKSELTQCLPSPPPMNPAAANAMARHVVTKLRKEAVAMMNREKGAATQCHRMASPIARMRSSEIQETMELPDDRPVPKKETKTDGEVKKEKQRQWKKKAKIAQANQRRERRALHEEYDTVGTDSYNAAHNPLIGCVLDNVERTDFFKRITACGAGGAYARNACTNGECDGSASGSDSSSTTGSYSEDDNTTECDDDTTGEGNNGGRPGTWRQRKKKWESPSKYAFEDHSAGPSVDTTVPEEMTRSFLTDDGMDHHENGAAIPIARNRPKFELAPSRTDMLHQRSKHKSEKLNRSADSINSDYARVGYNSSVHTSRESETSGTSGSMTSRINHTSMNRSITSDDSPSFVKAFLQDMESKGESMLWHQETSSMDPTTVVIRLKRGYRLPNGQYCSPRLIWTDLRTKKHYGFDVFEIRSLDRANMLHLKDFPYAMPGHSVLLYMNNNSTFIFEAGTQEDMIRFVRGIRWVVARLAYNLAIGNLAGSCELLDLGFADLKRNQLWDAQREKLPDHDWPSAMDDITEIMIDTALDSAFEI